MNSSDEELARADLESELLTVEPTSSLEEELPTVSNDVGLCGSVGDDEELSSEHAKIMTIGKVSKAIFLVILGSLSIEKKKINAKLIQVVVYVGAVRKYHAHADQYYQE